MWIIKARSSLHHQSHVHTINFRLRIALVVPVSSWYILPVTYLDEQPRVNCTCTLESWTTWWISSSSNSCLKKFNVVSEIYFSQHIWNIGKHLRIITIRKFNYLFWILNKVIVRLCLFYLKLVLISVKCCQSQFLDLYSL